ncbi:hypothetical protein HHI36_023556 [Cryptolaemus montrouzieri]|uniref:Uncharacterized protein n=1 Tax=Cryptolaemus montrouzieri TaxID=559131 RepID=A0ABD2PGW3_9CUCU
MSNFCEKVIEVVRMNITTSSRILRITSLAIYNSPHGPDRVFCRHNFFIICLFFCLCNCFSIFIFENFEFPQIRRRATPLAHISKEAHFSKLITELMCNIGSLFITISPLRKCPSMPPPAYP